MNKTGMVYLVGAGPGGEELMTKRGEALLREAETLLYDRLASPRFLSLAPEGCEKIFVGKGTGNHSVPQEEINRLLVQKAKEGRRVVRLKGGDAFVFGRGGEEVLALEAAGVPYEVVPGVTSAIGALAAAGIPVTHRGKAESFHVITGHTAGEEEPERFRQYAKLEGTLVFLMGVGNLSLIAEQLLKGGRPGDTPAAIVEQGAGVRQRRIDASLEGIVQAAGEQRVKPPAILVVGEAAAFHMVSGLRPLSGRRIGVTGTAAMTEKLEKGLRDMGALVCGAPYLKITPTDALRKRKPEWERFSWLVFTSANGVKQFFGQIKEMDVDIRALAHLRFGAVGPGTAAALWEQGIHADYMPDRYTVEALARGLSERLVKGKDRLLLLRAKEGSPDIQRIWREKDVDYEDTAIYEITADRDMAARLWQQTDVLDSMIFTSAFGVRAFFAAKEGGVLPENLVCIGPKTARALRECLPEEDWGRIKTAEEYTAEGLLAYFLNE